MTPAAASHAAPARIRRACYSSAGAGWLGSFSSSSLSGSSFFFFSSSSSSSSSGICDQRAVRQMISPSCPVLLKYHRPQAFAPMRCMFVCKAADVHMPQRSSLGLQRTSEVDAMRQAAKRIHSRCSESLFAVHAVSR